MIHAGILAWLAWSFVMLLIRSVRVRFVNRDSAEGPLTGKKNVIYAFFHGDMVPLLHVYRNSGILIPASESRDGEIIARVLKNFGFDVVRGSSKRKGHKALRELITGMRSGKTVAISVDGPRGPLHEVKPGVVYLGGLLKIPIVPVAVSAKRFRTIGQSWDRLMIPAPFTECVILYGDPVFVRGTSDEEIDAARRTLEARLRGLKQQAQSIFPNNRTDLRSTGPV